MMPGSSSKSKGAIRPVLILDYGSQYTQLIARRVRELSIYSVILPGDLSLQRIEELNPVAIVLSGGPNSVYEAEAPGLAPGLLEYCARGGVAILGVCYGMQLLVRDLGGKVKRGTEREYGRRGVQFLSSRGPFSKGDLRAVWMSHGDEVVELPPSFEVVAKSVRATGELHANAWIEAPLQKIMAIQFHPEVTHSEGGQEILSYFLNDFAKVKANWTMGSIRDEQIQKIRTMVGPDQHVICALSGGVDSAVAAKLVSEAVGDRLHCVFVDHGMLRFKEQERVMSMFKENLHLPVECVQAQERFFSELRGVVDPEQKRKIIGKLFIEEFDRYSVQLEKRLGSRPKFLVQGTLYPDVIESSPGHKHAVTIKSHHNVGGLPKDLKFNLIEPLRELFKDEVRALGRELGVAESFLARHPFPGPGLAVRIIGEVTEERVKTLQEVDEVFIQALHRADLYRKIWQAFAVFLPIKSVGVQGDGRTHDHVVALRAVHSSDGMTADWFAFEPKFLAEVSSEICNRVRGVNRVVYDISSKPPATIEWE